MKFFEKIFLLRIEDWIHYLGFPILGMVFGGFSKNLVPITLLSGFILAYAFSLNEVYDKKIESKIYLLPLLLSFLMFFFINPIQIAFALFFILIMTLYSYPIPRLKSKPIVCTIANAIAFPCLFAIGFFDLGIMNYSFVYIFSILFSLSFVIQLIHELSDVDEDKKEKVATTPIYFGESNTRIMIWFFLMITIMISFLSYSVNPSLLLLIPFSLYSIVRTTKKDWYKIRVEFRYFGTFIGAVITVLEILY